MPSLSLPRLLVVAGCLVLLGCGSSGSTLCEVAGTVTFKGEPVPAGRIYFNPDFEQKNDGQQGSAEIKDGKFDTRQGGQASVSGPIKVRIEGYEKGSEGRAGKRLFVEYEIKLELPKGESKQTFEVPASAAKGLVPNTGPDP